MWLVYNIFETFLVPCRDWKTVFVLFQVQAMNKSFAIEYKYLWTKHVSSFTFSHLQQSSTFRSMFTYDCVHND
jgi:hypothetical protein